MSCELTGRGIFDILEQDPVHTRQDGAPTLNPGHGWQHIPGARNRAARIEVAGVDEQAALEQAVRHWIDRRKDDDDVRSSLDRDSR